MVLQNLPGSFLRVGWPNHLGPSVLLLCRTRLASVAPQARNQHPVAQCFCRFARLVSIFDSFLWNITIAFRIEILVLVGQLQSCRQVKPAHLTWRAQLQRNVVFFCYVKLCFEKTHLVSFVTAASYWKAELSQSKGLILILQFRLTGKKASEKMLITFIRSPVT